MTKVKKEKLEKGVVFNGEKQWIKPIEINF